MSSIIQIPGFFFDPVKKRYFKIEKNATSHHQYNDVTLNVKKAEEQRAAKRARISQHREFQRTPPNPYPSFLSVANKIQPTVSQVQQDVNHIVISQLKLRKHFQYSLPTTLTKAQPLSNISGKMIIASDLNNVYSINREQNVPDDSTVFPHLIRTRLNKSTSILRNLDILQNKFIMRTWYGSLDEPSELEVLGITDQLEIISANHLVSTKKESFNTSDFNSITNKVTICTNKSILVTEMETLRSKEEHTIDGDALSIGNRDPFTSYIGFRSGNVKSWDNREKFSKGKTYKPKSLRSITNIKFTDSNKLVCSSIGSKLHLYDIRWGFEGYIQDFHTIKNVVNVFGESISVDDKGHFMLHSKDLVEIYDDKRPEPLKVITNHDRQGRHILGATWDTTPDPRDNELVTLSNDSIDIYQ